MTWDKTVGKGVGSSMGIDELGFSVCTSVGLGEGSLVGFNNGSSVGKGDYSYVTL